MLTCPYCQHPVQNLNYHLNHCQRSPYSLKAPNNKRKLPSGEPKISRYASIRKSTETSVIESSLSKDIHDAPNNIVSDQLHLIPSLRQQAKTVLSQSSTSDNNFDPEDLDDVAYDVPDLLLNKKIPSEDFNSIEIPISDKYNAKTSDCQLSDELLKFIDPDRPDPFDPNEVDEDNLQFIKDSHSYVGKLPDHLLAQIDLLRILSRSGCSLAIYDRIIQWVLHYSKKSKKRNIWVESEIMKRKPLMKRLKKIFQTEQHEPTPKQVIFPYDGRSATIPTFSFLTEAMSLIHDPSTMSSDNIISGYDIYSGKSGQWFWKNTNSSRRNIKMKPTDPQRKIGDITTSFTFQQSVQRFCSKPHHMPVPIIFFMTRQIWIGMVVWRYLRSFSHLGSSNHLVVVTANFGVRWLTFPI